MRGRIAAETRIGHHSLGRVRRGRAAAGNDAGEQVLADRREIGGGSGRRGKGRFERALVGSVGAQQGLTNAGVGLVGAHAGGSAEVEGEEEGEGDVEGETALESVEVN